MAEFFGDGRPLLAVMVDADNVSANDAEVILKEIESIGEPSVRRVYGDWSSGSLNGWAKVIPELGFTARQVAANTKNKNASDIGMVIDAMDMLHEGRFDMFVIVSSDSDFTALANRLREAGKTVVGIGEQKVPPSLRKVCNRFLLIENLRQDAPKAKEATQNSSKPAKTKAEKPDAEQAPKLAPPVKPLPLFKEAFDKLDDLDGWYHLGVVGKQIYATNPDFDPRSYGHKKLSEMVKRLRGLETKSDGNHLMIRLKTG